MWKKKSGTNSAPSIRAPEEIPPRIPTISRLMALAIKLDRGGREAQNNYADIARSGGVTRAKITQVMNLLNLAPDIQEEILFLPTRICGTPRITEKQIRPIASIVDWERQREMWREIYKPTESMSL